jgi:hypothetical protein
MQKIFGIMDRDTTVNTNPFYVDLIAFLTHNTPCAVVGRLMPCSPGSPVPSGLPRPGSVFRDASNRQFNSRRRRVSMPVMTVRLIKHESVPCTGSFEVRFADVRRSAYFYFDELPSRRLGPEWTVREQALGRARIARSCAAPSRVGTRKFPR